MGRGLFEPWHLLILVIVIAVLFGGKRLPDAARGLGRSMRIFKSEIKQMQDDDKPKDSARPEHVRTEPLEGRIMDGETTRTPSADTRRDL